MSVLSSPQGTPERVWSLIAGLVAIGSECDRETFDALLNPGYQKDGAEVRANKVLAANAVGAATSLGLVQAGREKVTLTTDRNLDGVSEFAEYVHDHLSSLKSGETDSAILEAYAWLVAKSHQQGQLDWIYTSGRDEFADMANAALVGEDDDGRLINTTKVVAWRRWLTFLGLGVTLPLPSTNKPDYPTPTARLVRELNRAGISPNTVMSAEQFISLVAGRMPYLDRGRLFTQACQRIGHTPSGRRVSPLLSLALRDLHDDKVLGLILSGDASTHLQLTPEDPAHSFNAFTAVNIFPAGSL
jgi:hypothetical protein